jgi:GT2 family glycosyltransferase
VPDTVDVEVLVVSFNSATTLGACLASVERSLPGTPIAIREHGTDPTSASALASLVAAHPSPVRVEHCPANPGFGAGCNALAASSSARYLLFLNPDAEILAAPWSPAESPPTETIIGPLMIDSGHEGAHSGVEYRIRDEIARSWLRRRGRRPQGEGFVSGAALLIDSASFERVGGFDEQYFMFYEDIDLCLRANAIGIGTRIDERWRVRHTGGHSTRSRFGRSLLWSYESATRFHARHGGSLRGYRLYVVADSAMRSVVAALRRRRHHAAAYAHLGRRALADLFGRRPAEG